MSYTYLCENSICSPGQEAESLAESLAECCSDTPQFALWRLNPTADASCSKDNATKSCHDSQFGTILPHSTPHLGEGALTSCAEVSLAKTFPPLEKAQESTAREADCGDTWPEWFAKFDPVTSSWRTRQCSLLAGLDVFSGTWPRWGMMRSGVCWGLATPVRRTKENGYGFWPTPVKTDGYAVGWCLTSIERKERGETRPSGAHIGTGLKYFRKTERYLSNGFPNPMFTEWLMGWPIKWTDLQPLETAKFQQWLHSHGAHSQDSNP
jgi:hypothetical protein